VPHIDDDILALHALGEDVLDDEQRAHLAACAACISAAAALSRVVDGARVPAAPELVPPPPAVWTRIHAELGLTDVPENLPEVSAQDPAESVVQPRAEAIATDETSGAAGASAEASGGTVVPLSARRPRRWAPVLVAAASALVIGIGAGVLWERQSVEPPETTIASATLEPLPDWQGSTGEAVVERTPSGERQIVVTLDAPAPEGTFREVWLLTPDVSGLVSLGVLDGDEGRFVLPEGLDLDTYSVVDVSEEAFDGDPAHSGQSVVRGPLAT